MVQKRPLQENGEIPARANGLSDVLQMKSNNLALGRFLPSVRYFRQIFRSALYVALPHDAHKHTGVDDNVLGTKLIWNLLFLHTMTSNLVDLNLFMRREGLMYLIHLCNMQTLRIGPQADRSPMFTNRHCHLFSCIRHFYTA